MQRSRETDRQIAVPKVTQNGANQAGQGRAELFCNQSAVDVVQQVQPSKPCSFRARFSGRKERVEFNCQEFAQENSKSRQESVFAVQSALVFAPWAPGGTEMDAAAG